MHRRAEISACIIIVVVAAALVADATRSLGGSSDAIATGSFSGVPWELAGDDGPDGSYCLTLKIPATSKSVGTESCGSIRVPGRYGPHGISYLAHIGAPRPNYVVGPVVASARAVEIKLADGTTLRSTTIAPPSNLFSGIRFYAAELPCPARPTRLMAFEGRRQPVARLTLPPPTALMHKISC